MSAAAPSALPPPARPNMQTTNPVQRRFLAALVEITYASKALDRKLIACVFGHEELSGSILRKYDAGWSVEKTTASVLGDEFKD